LAPKPGFFLRHAHLTTLLLILGFFLAQYPFQNATYRFHFDEKYYTDAAIRMLRHGDVLVPYYPDDTLRLRKPILTYWAILGGWKLGGVSYAAARTGMLLAMLGVMAATYQFAKRIFGRPEAGLIAVALLFSDYEVFTASWRLNPDALLALWVTLSLLGFAVHAFSLRGSSRGLMLGYVGAGLAMATKGFLGVGTILYGLAFCQWGSSHLPGTKRRTRVHFMGALVAIVIGGAWYVAMALRFGPSSLTDFLKDQAGLQPGGAGLGIAGHPPRYLFTTFGDFLPAFLLVLLGMRAAPRHLRGFWKENRRQILFALGWFVLIFLVFACGRVFRPRYLLPSHPLLAACFGAVIAHLLDAADMRGLMKLTRPWWIGTAALIGLVVALIGVRFDPRFPLAGATIFSIALICWMASRSAVSIVVGLCISIFGILWSYDAFLRPIFAETPASELAKRLEDVPETRPILCFGVPYRIQAQLAVLSGGRHIPRETRSIDLSPNGALPGFILPESRFAELPTDRYRKDAVAYTYRHPDLQLFLDSWRGRDREALLAERRRTFVLALPRE
jgi:4-amino-4-deoxy-L-arabinose transferase-like glycosyltransferase